MSANENRIPTTEHIYWQLLQHVPDIYLYFFLYRAFWYNYVTFSNKIYTFKLMF
jgi:hypothetical protein